MSRVVPFRGADPRVMEKRGPFDVGMCADAHPHARERAPGPSPNDILTVNKALGASVQEIIGEVEIETPASRKHRERQQTRFLKGPIPISCLAQAHRATGSNDTLAVWLMVIHLCDMARANTTTLPMALLKPFGISRRSRDRALQALQRAAMIRIDVGCPGRATRITLLVGHNIYSGTAISADGRKQLQPNIGR
jgi:hypothetical protein